MSTKIEWATETWNPVTGCTPISEGCQNCYAKTMTVRFGNRLFSEIRCHEDRLDVPKCWKKPRRIFVCSMGDLFHRRVPKAFLVDVWQTMMDCPQHTFMLLTKRPERAYKIIGSATENVWMGVTAENQGTADARISILLQTLATIRFVSVEPMLEEVDLRNHLHGMPECDPDPPLDWVICGAETGSGARAMDPDWARNLRDQCDAAGVPFFMKQMGKKEPIPEDLRRREWPK